MDLNQLTTFLTLSKLKNFTKTAEELDYAQSSITAQIKQLEKELGVRLFERISKTVTLTSEGLALVPYAARIMALSANMKEVVAPAVAMNGSITIGASESLCIYRLPSIIKAYKEKHPNVDIYLKLLKCNQFVPNLTENAVDLAFSIGDRIENGSIQAAKEISEPISILAAPNHPLAVSEHITLRDFEAQAFILTGQGCCYRGAFEKDLMKENIKVKMVLETDSIQAIKQIAMSGLGICVLPDIAVTEEVAAKRLIPIAYQQDYRIVSQILYHKSKWLSPLLSDFIEEASTKWTT